MGSAAESFPFVASERGSGIQRVDLREIQERETWPCRGVRSTVQLEVQAGRLTQAQLSVIELDVATF